MKKINHVLEYLNVQCGASTLLHCIPLRLDPRTASMTINCYLYWITISVLYFPPRGEHPLLKQFFGSDVIELDGERTLDLFSIWL